MASTKAILLLVFCSSWLVCCSAEEGRAFAERLGPRLRYDPRRGRVSPHQRTSTRRTVPLEEQDDQTKEIESIRNYDIPIEMKIRRRGQHGSRKYLYQMEANINHDIHERILPSTLQDPSAEYNSEFIKSSSTQSENEENRYDENMPSVKTRDMKENMPKSLPKKNVLRSGNQNQGKQRRPIPQRSLFEKPFPSQSEKVGNLSHGIPQPEKSVQEFEGSKRENYPSDLRKGYEEERSYSDDFDTKQEKHHSSHGDHLSDTFSDMYAENERAREEKSDIAGIAEESQLFSVTPVPSMEPGALGFSNRHKKHPFGQEAPLHPQSHGLKPHRSGNIFPEEWVLPDVTHDVVSSEGQRQTGPTKQIEENAGFERGSRFQAEGNSHPENENFESTLPFIREHELSPSFTQRTYLSPGERVSARDKVHYSYIPPRNDPSTTTTTPRPEWWSAERARYSFSTNQEDGISDLSHDRQESRDGGRVEGSYSYSDGYYLRTVHYIADRDGYRIISESSKALSLDGPQVNPDGHASVRAEVDGHAYDYIVHGRELPRRSKYYEPTEVQEDYAHSRIE